MNPPDGPLSLADWNAQVIRSMTERQLEDLVLVTAGACGWLRFHALPVTNQYGRTRTAQRGDVGFPDLVLAHHAAGELIVAELKSERGALTPEQRRWLAAMEAAGVEAQVWRPRHWFDGTITARLRQPLTTTGRAT